MIDKEYERMAEQQARGMHQTMPRGVALGAANGMNVGQQNVNIGPQEMDTLPIEVELKRIDERLSRLRDALQLHEQRARLVLAPEVPTPNKMHGGAVSDGAPVSVLVQALRAIAERLDEEQQHVARLTERIGR